MAMVYRVKDGPRGERTDEGHKISVSELTKKLANYQCRYLSENTPYFNTDKPTDYFKHVVIEVSDEGELNNMFPKNGFYVVADLDASQSAFLYQ
jgi:hypothetical protein